MRGVISSGARELRDLFAKRLSRREALRRVVYGVAAASIPMTGASFCWYGVGIEPHRIDIVRAKASLPRLPHAFVGLTIAQLSDLHFGRFVGQEQLHAAVNAVLRLQPDVIAITGDFITKLQPGDGLALQQEMMRLSAPLGTFAVLGNHDYWEDVQIVTGILDRAGIKLLANASAAISRAGEVLHIVGIDDVWEKRNDLAAGLAEVPANGCAVMLVHEPDFAEETAQDGRVALQLSGHSHGGQVRIPPVPRAFIPPLGRKFPLGLCQVGGTKLYTNRGIGVVFPPLRLNCPPEVTLLELTL